MGTSESKMAVASTPKPEPIRRLKAQHLGQLEDPRSPSCGFNRTPIQVTGANPAVQAVESVGPVFVDPRSPTVGIVRTPLKDSMKVTVSSLARRLSMFFLNDATMGESGSAPLPNVSFSKPNYLPSVEPHGELKTKEPLLSHRSCDSVSGPTDCPSTPADFSSSMGYGSLSSSPFVVLGQAKMEVELDADTTIDEAEEAVLLGESPLKQELSLSMLGCREGVYSPEFFPSSEERPTTPLPPLEEKQDLNNSCALPSVTHEPGNCAPVPAQEVLVSSMAADAPEQESVEEETSKASEHSLKLSQNSKLADSQPAPSEVILPPITFPKFDTCSPSQAIFKPQWLGVGFGATGVRAKGVQSRGRGPSSPLSSRIPATDENENRVVLNKQKQRGKPLIGEGRSPLQILKETNSPRKNTGQMKLKVSTPEKLRFVQMDRRALVLSLNKENQ